MNLMDYSSFFNGTSLNIRPPQNHDQDLNLNLGLDPSSPPPPFSRPSSSSSKGGGGRPRVFSCNYCQRKFYSSQALGGHQNAHKLERTLAKKSRKLMAMAGGLQSSSSSSPSSSGAVVPPINETGAWDPHAVEDRLSPSTTSHGYGGGREEELGGHFDLSLRL